ncbi:hypothetical protein O0L34_g2965 [Tuta absoluta]|nr:hypothetical protein O0L34_g2965 [Tuta absoluta]
MIFFFVAVQEAEEARLYIFQKQAEERAAKLKLQQQKKRKGFKIFRFKFKLGRKSPVAQFRRSVSTLGDSETKTESDTSAPNQFQEIATPLPSTSATPQQQKEVCKEVTLPKKTKELRINEPEKREQCAHRICKVHRVTAKLCSNEDSYKSGSFDKNTLALSLQKDIPQNDQSAQKTANKKRQPDAQVCEIDEKCYLEEHIHIFQPIIYSRAQFQASNTREGPGRYSTARSLSPQYYEQIERLEKLAKLLPTSPLRPSDPDSQQLFRQFLNNIKAIATAVPCLGDTPI